MKASTRQARILGFSSIERAIFEGLTERPESPSELARRLKRSRTSLLRPLASLADRGFVERVRVGKRTAWKKASLSSALGLLYPGDALSRSHPEFFLHTGRDALVGIYDVFCSSKKTRVLFIQPNHSLISALEHMSEEYLIDLNTKIKTNEVIMEGILHEDVVHQWFSAVRKRGWSVESMSRAVMGRAADTTYVPKDFLNFDTEILILPEVAYILNWNRLVAIETRNADTVGLLRDIFMFGKLIGKKVDLNALIENERKAQNEPYQSAINEVK